MSNQIRTIVQQSIEKLHQFFTSYRFAPVIQYVDPIIRTLTSIIHSDWVLPENVNASGPVSEQDTNTLVQNMPRPAFRLTLRKKTKVEAKDVNPDMPVVYEITYDTAPELILFKVDECFSQILSILQHIPCVQHKIFPTIDADKTYLKLNVDQEAGARLELLRQDIKELLAISIREANTLKTLYSEYTYIFNKDQELRAWLGPRPATWQDGATPVHHTLAEYLTEINRYRAVADLLHTKTHSTVRSPVIELDCADVNAQLIRHAHELSLQICNHINAVSLEKNRVIANTFHRVLASLERKTFNFAPEPPDDVKEDDREEWKHTAAIQARIDDQQWRATEEY